MNLIFPSFFCLCHIKLSLVNTQNLINFRTEFSKSNASKLEKNVFQTSKIQRHFITLIIDYLNNSINYLSWGDLCCSLWHIRRISEISLRGDTFFSAVLCKRTFSIPWKWVNWLLDGCLANWTKAKAICIVVRWDSIVLYLPL